MAATYLGMAVGLVLGTVWFVIALIRERAGFADGLAILIGGMLGSSAGFLYGYLKQRETRREDRTKQ
jgi:hypothetical protein